MSYDWVWQENENERKQNLQAFFDYIVILWGFSLGFSENDKEGNPTKPDWKRGYQIEIRCPQGKLRHNREKDCFEGSPISRINDTFNNVYLLQKRMLHCLTTTRNSEGDIILPDPSKWISRLIRYNKKTGEPSIPIKLNGDSVEETQSWVCNTRMFKGKTPVLYDNPTELVERHCYKMVASLNVDFVSFAICLQPVSRVQCSTMCIFNEGSHKPPVSRPVQPDAEDYIEEHHDEEEDPFGAQHEPLDDAVLATMLDKAQDEAIKKASIEFNDRNHQEQNDEEKQDESRPSKRQKGNEEKQQDDDEDEHQEDDDEQKTSES
jgi:hypothetical protein